jgi:hypothetical protein
VHLNRKTPEVVEGTDALIVVKNWIFFLVLTLLAQSHVFVTII